MSWGCSPGSAVSGASRRWGEARLGSETRGRRHTVARSWPRLATGLALGLQVPGLAAVLRAPSSPPGQCPGARLCMLCDPEAPWAHLGGQPLELAERCLLCCQTPGRVQWLKSREARSAHSFIDSPAFSRKPSRWLSTQSSRGAAAGLRPSQLPMVIQLCPASARYLSPPPPADPQSSEDSPLHPQLLQSATRRTDRESTGTSTKRH